MNNCKYYNMFKEVEMELKEKQKSKRLGELCQKYRKELGFTQEELAKVLNCTRENISMFENGKNNNANILCWYIIHNMLGYEEYKREFVKIFVEGMK